MHHPEQGWSDGCCHQPVQIIKIMGLISSLAVENRRLIKQKPLGANNFVQYCPFYHQLHCQDSVSIHQLHCQIDSLPFEHLGILFW